MKKFLILLYLVVLSSIVTWILLKMKLFQTFFKLPSFENFCVFNLEACGICHRFYLNFKNNVLSPHVLHIDSSPRPPPPPSCPIKFWRAPSRSMFTIPVENPVTWPVLFETPFFRYLSLCLQVRSENFSWLLFTFYSLLVTFYPLLLTFYSLIATFY